MSSSRTEPRSIATQLVLLFTLCAALLLSCSLGVFYWIVVRHAFEEDNAVLADKVRAIRDTLQQPNGLDTISHEQKNLMPGEPAVYWVRVIGPDENPLIQTPGMENLLPAKAFPLAKQSGLPITNYRNGNKLYSLTAALDLVAGNVYVIQIAQDRSGDERVAREFGLLAICVIVIGSGVAAALAVTVTRRGLLPLAKMRRTFERVQPAHLNERIDPARWPRELRPLAASFDDMLCRLDDSFTRLSQFSADLAHELRTPIGNMLGEAQVALIRNRNSDEYRAVVESTAAECERLSGIIDNLLFLARADSAEQQVTRESFNARPAIEKIVTYYRTLAEDRHVQITCDGDTEILADPILFNRAIGNVIDNALRFVPDHGNISISIRTAENGAEISVSDNGSGIAAEHLPRVFDRFYRADPSRSSAGTGLGLALVKSIVQLHGGTAAIQSRIGHGTAVTLFFPNEAAAERI